MGYTALNTASQFSGDLESAALSFIHDYCEGLRFDPAITAKEDPEKRIFFGKSIGSNMIPYNMQADLDRLCLENAVRHFLKSGRKEDAFDVYFCYLEMFVGNYRKTQYMIELLSEFEANGSGLLMKHRDHYSHSVYVFVLGLAIYRSNMIFRETYQNYYHLSDPHEAACHFLQYWGLASLFHDIGYPFELPFEQATSYFEVSNKDNKDDDRSKHPFLAYQNLNALTAIAPAADSKVHAVLGTSFITTDTLFAHLLAEKLGSVYHFTEDEMCARLMSKPTRPNEFGFFMDHAYFSATVLFQKLFGEMDCAMTPAHLDALTAILMHNSLYKFSIAYYKNPAKNIPFKAELHPLAFMLMLCDELQCWDRTAYGRNSKVELHPMNCNFSFSEDTIHATYIFDKQELPKTERFREAYQAWKDAPAPKKKAPALKAYSGMYITDSRGVSDFQADIERIVDLSSIHLLTDHTFAPSIRSSKLTYLSNSNFLSLYNFALVLNGRWSFSAAWKEAKAAGREDAFLADKTLESKFNEIFDGMSLEYKLSNINQAKGFARILNEIDCFYTDKPVDFELVESFTEDDLLKMGPLEHMRWLQEHADMGWTYGTPTKADRELVRQHADMIPYYSPEQGDITFEQALANYRRLGKEEQDKDTEPMECLLAMLKIFDGLQIYRLH